MAFNFEANQTLVGFSPANNVNNYCGGFSLAAIFRSMNIDGYRPVNLNLNTLAPNMDLAAINANQTDYVTSLCTYAAIQAVQNDTNEYVTDRYEFLTASFFLGNSTRMSLPSGICSVISQASAAARATVSISTNVLPGLLDTFCEQAVEPWVGAVDAGIIIQDETQQIQNLGNNFNVVNVLNNYNALPPANNYDLVLVNNVTHWIAVDHNSIYDPGTGLVYTNPAIAGGNITGQNAAGNGTWSLSGLWIRIR